MEIYVVQSRWMTSHHPDIAKITPNRQEAIDTLERLKNTALATHTDAIEQESNECACTIKWGNELFEAWIDLSDIAMEMRVPTPKGTLIVDETDDTEYPGFNIDLELPCGERIAVATVESNIEDDSNITTYVFGDARDDFHTAAHVLKNLNKVSRG